MAPSLKTILTLCLPTHHCLGLVVMSLCCFTLMFVPSSITQYLDLSNLALSDWQIWRLFSAHFLHTNAWHLGMNLVGIYLIWLLFSEYFYLPALIWVILMCTLGLSTVLLLINDPQNELRYLGLSGTLHGLFAFALSIECSKKQLSTFVMIVIGIGKLAYEQMGGSTENTAVLIGANVAIDAHLWGAVLGVLAAFLLMLYRLICKPTSDF